MFIIGGQLKSSKINWLGWFWDTLLTLLDSFVIDWKFLFLEARSGRAQDFLGNPGLFLIARLKPQDASTAERSCLCARSRRQNLKLAPKNGLFTDSASLSFYRPSCGCSSLQQKFPTPVFEKFFWSIIFPRAFLHRRGTPFANSLDLLAKSQRLADSSGPERVLTHLAPTAKVLPPRGN